MNIARWDRKAARYALVTAMAATFVSGCASSGLTAMNSSAKDSEASLDRATAKQIAQFEKQVAKAPQDAATRAALGQAYLQAGRFESAITAFEDARYLGDKSARIALGLSLAYSGAGNNGSAVAVLDEWDGEVAPSDFGLALALAGETERGVSVLAEALRAGDGSAKLRQNLAYAYALDGRWREARLMASQDVPADQLDARISEWALQGRPDDYRARVASLLDAPVISDAGQPAHLALSRIPAAPGQAPVQMAANTAPSGELPPVENGESFWLAEAARPEPAPVAQPAAQPVAPVVASAPANPAAGFVSRPVVQTVPQRVAVSEPAPRIAAKPQRKSREVAPVRSLMPQVKAAGGGTHLVQLGSFTSAQSAERGWNIFVTRNPQLKAFDKTISQAMVNGKKYWRVSAAGFDKASASRMCSSVKAKGGACLPWSQSQPLPGAI